MSTSESCWATFAMQLAQQVRFDLITVLDVNRAEGLVQRSYSSDEIHYPSGGIKRLMDSSWAAHVIDEGKVFRSENQKDFREAFFDHALLESLGLAFALNIPRQRAGVVYQTLNLLQKDRAFSETEAATVTAALTSLRAPRR